MNSVLLDSNIIIYLGKKVLPLQKIFFPDTHYFISVITYMEVLGYSFNHVREKNYIESLINNFPCIYVNRTIADSVITLSSKRKIKLPDAIIAATAITNRCVLMTRNETDFRNIEHLQIINPFKP